jgi:NAD(P)-dependent dehydrogenase (short-subunit alcohol dehydrogenase family)
MNEATPLAGKTALVTGASRGFGLAIARRLRAAGAGLILAARGVVDLSELESDERGQSTRIRGISVDLSRPADVDALHDFCLDSGLFPDILVNNAAIQGPIGPLSAVDFAAWRTVMEVNFFAAARLCQQFIEPMRKKGWGKIINISGGGATSPRPDFSAYASSKAALVRLSETLAVETAGAGIDINCVAPGAMNTRMLDELLARGPSGATREYEKALKQKEVGGASPDKAAELVLFLASPASDGITGRLFSAVWDHWQDLPAHREELAKTDIYTLRRIVPEDRGRKW